MPLAIVKLLFKNYCVSLYVHEWTACAYIKLNEKPVGHKAEYYAAVVCDGVVARGVGECQEFLTKAYYSFCCAVKLTSLTAACVYTYNIAPQDS